MSWYGPEQLMEFTDHWQPVDDDAGKNDKVNIGYEMEEWMENENNLEKWESKGLTASDRRILLTHWLANAAKKTLAGDAKWKYFEHTGALITADGFGDDLLKLDGNPKNESFGIPPPTITGPHGL